MISLFKKKPESPPHPDDECEVLKRNDLYVIRHVKSGTYFDLTARWICHDKVYDQKSPKSSTDVYIDKSGVRISNGFDRESAWLLSFESAVHMAKCAEEKLSKDRLYNLNKTAEETKVWRT